GVVRARADGRERRQSRYLFRYELIGRRLIAELAVAVGAPAPELAVRVERAGVPVRDRVAAAHRHLDDGADAGEAEDRRRGAAVVARAVAERAIAVGAPAVGFVASPGTGVTRALDDADGQNAAVRSEPQIGRAVVHRQI